MVGLNLNAYLSLLFSSPVHKVLQESDCDRPMSSARRLSTISEPSSSPKNHRANLDDVWQESKNLIPPLTLAALATKRKKKC